MHRKEKIQRLEKSIERFYHLYSVKRVTAATLMVGLGSLAAAFGVFYLTGSALFSGLACLVTGFALINICFLAIVPPAKALEETKEMICATLKDPSRIVSFSKQEVRLKDKRGQVHTLKPRDRAVWLDQVVPHLIASQAEAGSEAAGSAGRKLNASEWKLIEERRQEVFELEKNITEERRRLKAERKEIEQRTADLNEAEEVVISRLNKVEQAEAELEQLKLNTTEQAEADASSLDSEAAEAREAKLQKKEAEISKMRERLAEDREVLEQQKREMERLRASATRSPFKARAESDAPLGLEQSLEAREAALEARSKELEAAAEDLEERASFVTESENSLIERLDALTHREATVEQSEIDSGLRKD